MKVGDVLMLYIPPISSKPYSSSLLHELGIYENMKFFKEVTSFAFFVDQFYLKAYPAVFYNHLIFNNNKFNIF